MTFPFALLLAAVLAIQGPAPLPELPLYTGEDVCLECHAPEQVAAPCALEAIEEHARAFGDLRRAESVDIAAICGIPGAPTESRICLGCHATAADDGPRWTAAGFDLTRGVQCEACHGPGSRHVDACRAGDPGQLGIRPGDRDACGSCHVPLPSHDEVLVKGYRKPEADRLYKTPTALAISRDGARLYGVSSNTDAVLVIDTAERRVLTELAVGRRPHGITLGPQGRFLFVTSRFDDTLSVVDLEARAVAAVVPVGHDPHGIALDESGETILVLNTGEDSISVIDRGSLKELRRLVAGAGPWALVRNPRTNSFLATSVRPQPAGFRQVAHSEITVVSCASGVVLERLKVPGANMLEGIACVPESGIALFTLVRSKDLVPLTRLAQGWGICNGLGVIWPDGRVDQVLLDAPGDYFPDPTDIAVDPRGRVALVTSAGANQVAVVDIEKLTTLLQEASPLERAEVLPDHLGTSRRFVRRRIPVGASPRGVVFAPDGRRAYVANALDDTVTVIETEGFTAVARIDLGGPQVLTETRHGQRLFHDASSTYGRQFSCHSCHPDGHINGLTLDIEPDGLGVRPVDNRTLRGIFDTPPFKWEGTNPSIQRQCGARLAVFFTRLTPLMGADLDALVRYMATIERPRNRFRRADGLTASQRRGKAVFERTTTGSGREIPPGQRCITCHGTPYGTSRTMAEVGTTMWLDVPGNPDVDDLSDAEDFGYLGTLYFFGLPELCREFDTPHLTNICNGAPYLHNGSAPTLPEIWTLFNFFDRHGVTSDLTRRQFNDLIAYLKAF